MPVHQLRNGEWQWGQSGKKYPTKQQAEKQGEAAHANGYSDGMPEPPGYPSPMQPIKGGK